MKEFPHTYKFDKGLRPYDDMGRDLPGLVECYNLVPRRGRLLGHSPLLPVPSVTLDWPFPQLFCLPGGNFLCGRDYINTLDSTLNVIQSYPTTPALTPWTLVDSWQYVILTNGAATYVTELVGGAIVPYIGSSLIQSKYLMNYKQQIIASGVQGLPENVIVAGAIGAASMVPIDGIVSPVEIVQIPMPWAGGIVGQMRLGDKIVVYGEAGIAVLTPISGANVPSFKLDDTFPESLQRLGVVAFGGDYDTHCFVDETGNVWKIKGNMEIQELGYSEFIAPMLGGTIRISYDPRSLFRDFYISDGTITYLLTEYGMGKVGQVITSSQLFRGGQFGVGETNNVSWRIETDLVDMLIRGKKDIEWLEIAGNNLYNVAVKADGITGPTLPVSPDGRARAKMHGSDFSYILSGPSCEGVVLEELIARIKYVDKTTMRSEPHVSKITPGANR